MQRTRLTAVARALGGACRSSSHAAVQRRSMSRAVVSALPARQQQAQQQRQQLCRHQHAPLISSASKGPSPAIQPRRHASSSSSAPTELRKTTLYDFHLARGAKMVPFAGFHMPVQYSDQGVSQSHLFTRSHASIFDVGHMVQRLFTGPGAAKFLERITPAAASSLSEFCSTLSAILKEDGSGGIVDDTIITRLPEGVFYVVTNAGCRDKDNAYLDREIAKWNAEFASQGLEVAEDRMDKKGLIALQGPESASILSRLVLDPGKDEPLDLRTLLFGHSTLARVNLPHKSSVSSLVLISRGGYTGEDGFEISISEGETVDVTEALLEAGGPERVRLAGLGARDSLRLEAGMCLYGHDLDEATTPVEAGLAWIVPKERRTADAGYYGAEVIAKQLVPQSKGGEGVSRRRVGLLVEGAPAREGAEIVPRGEAKEETVGIVTSGCPSPSLGKNIAMGYVKDGLHKVGTEVDVLVRGRPRKAVVTKMPFVPTKYWKGDA
ncbi:hypothetical protein VTJ49DRAFT_2916 [Mycothermus thermophilus]|uniref:Aminomethyltransferase n=1 Tax=Humicola insolens TaxID=85995 RepID=A0ABR3VQE5_HUMIN